jgi:hypothetical protein
MWSFAASVTGSSNAGVIWSTQEGSVGGTISNTGVYTAPVVDGIFHVVATAEADAAKNAIATVNVLSAGFTSIGNLSSARLAHTATLLPNGKVLIAGGGSGSDLYDGLFVVEGAELFDPVTGSSTSAGVVSRDFHSATLLLDGNVLLAGGETGYSGGFPIVTNTAEVEKETSGLFEPTGSLAAARESHAETLLSDGRVLVTGGVTPVGIGWQPLRSAEVYDPASGTFLKVADMNVGRVFHTATLLADGQVLIVGGDSSDSSDTAELFDPVTGSFTLTGRMTAARLNHTATRLPNGKVLVAGGPGDTATAELYDPNTGLFTPTGNMATGRSQHTATLLPDGTVLMAGGLTMLNSIENETATTEIYDPASGSFRSGATMRQGRFWHTATLLPGGAVLFIGGASSSDGDRITVLTSAEIYN